MVGVKLSVCLHCQTVILLLQVSYETISVGWISCSIMASCSSTISAVCIVIYCCTKAIYNQQCWQTYRYWYQSARGLVILKELYWWSWDPLVCIGWWQKANLVTKNLGPDFRKILRQSYDNLRIFIQYILILRQIYDIMTIVRTLLTL